MRQQDLGMVTAYAYAVSQGYTGTEEEFAELMASYATVAEEAAESAAEAAASAEAAGTSEAHAASSAASAGQSATSAGNSAASASGSAVQAQSSATAAGQSATQAAGSATAAGNSATAAAGSASQAAASETAAGASATAAAGSATSASGSATAAAGSATEADASADRAQEILDSIPEDYSEMSEDVADLKSAFEEFPEGTYPDMTVGGVMSVDGGTEDQVPYIFRASGGGVAVGNREIDTLVGGTVAWNQIQQNGNFVNTNNWDVNGSSAFTVANNEGTVTLGDSPSGTLYLRTPISPIAGHKYLMSAEIKSSDATVVRFMPPDGTPTSTFTISTAYTRCACISAGDASVSYINFLRINQSDPHIGGCVYNIKDAMLFDLTAMFGTAIADYIYALETATAGAGVAWFKRLFPNDYYAYDAGSLKSVEGVSAHVMSGKNLWNPNTYETFDIVGDGSTLRYGHSYPPGTYTVINNTDTTLYYRKPKADLSSRGTTITINAGNSANVTVDVGYILWVFVNTVSGVNHDYAVMFGSDAEYEPYIAHTYPLDSSLTLRGIPKLDSANRLYYDGDRYSSNGTVTRRYGIVDLGTLIWQTNGRIFYTITAPMFGNGGNAKVGGGVLCPIYTNLTVDSTNPTDMRIFVANIQATPVLRTSDSRYTDVNAYKTAMSGVMALVELYTPVTETAEPYTNPQIVDNLGTEEYVTTGIVPVGHNTKYPTDIVAKVDGLPSDFSTLIAVTETGYKATRAYSVNQFLIVNTQLYKVTASIASGATITPGTNVTAVTVADILTQLLNA